METVAGCVLVFCVRGFVFSSAKHSRVHTFLYSVYQGNIPIVKRIGDTVWGDTVRISPASLTMKTRGINAPISTTYIGVQACEVSVINKTS